MMPVAESKPSWTADIERLAFSTSRGFVFQYPPFPALGRAEGAEVHAPRPAGLYVHIPFCPYRCSFCYYVVQPNSSAVTVGEYLDALDAELSLLERAGVLVRQAIRTVYIGGGTPTYLDERRLVDLLEMLRRRVDLGGVEELTVEADPTTMSVEKGRALRRLGVNRVSIGVQSFSADVNRTNGRRHGPDEVWRAIDAVRAAGIDNINLDLIGGLPGATDEMWRWDIEQALASGCEHITLYLLSLRPQTPAFRLVEESRSPRPAGEEERVARLSYARERLLAEGLLQTTPNCFIRRPTCEHLHQRNAWSSLPLLGVGVSAYSFIDPWVTQNTRSLKSYLDSLREGRLPVEIGARLDAKELMLRYFILGLKQLRIVRSDFRERFGFDCLFLFGEKTHALADRGMLEVDDAEIRLTERGIIYVDDVCRWFYSADVLNKITVADAAPLIGSLI